MFAKAMRKIQQEEGFSRTAYKCPAGYWTIGAGINLEKTPMPADLANEWAKRILVERVKTLVAFEWYRNLNDDRQIAIVDMSYQLGVSGLLAFQKMIEAIKGKDYKEAANEMLDSRYAKQTPNRALRNAQIMRSGKLED